ncbi:sugar phosphate isomerase/epimerase family protein [Sphingobium sp. SCG-1]|uniref:sugar phosphate isomerase/epimerase family protein n=1 Tax=Sphingobium sp. SCG-1 TaxID=2072936 RepID=UPI001671874B|nr:TIM barrel protein [Sphingobium sp. SCG-1]
MPEATPLQLVEAASKAGFDYGGMWVDVESWTAKTTREVRAALRETGLPLLDVEVVWIKPGGLDPDHIRIVDIGIELGARNILCVSSDPDAGATRDKLAALMEHASGSDIRINLEFGMFAEVKTIRQATDILRQIDSPLAALLVDALHWRRSGGTLPDIAAIPPEWISYAQLCDARDPGADPNDPVAILDEAVDDRVALGRGDLPLRPLADMLPPNLPIAVEERSRALRDNFPDLNARAAELLRTSRAWMDGSIA